MARDRNYWKCCSCDKDNADRSPAEDGLYNDFGEGSEEEQQEGVSLNNAGPDKRQPRCTRISPDGKRCKHVSLQNKRMRSAVVG